MIRPQVHLIAPAGSCRPFLQALGVTSGAELIAIAQDAIGPTYDVTGDEELIEAREQERGGGRVDDIHRAADLERALGSDPVAAVQSIAHELEKFSPELAQRERWLVLNKIDLLPAEEREALCEAIIQRLDWQGPVFRIAALAGEGTQALVYAIMEHLEAERAQLQEAEAQAAVQAAGDEQE